MSQGIVLSGADIDFMIHGIVKYNFFGHEVWITTTHVSIAIVMLLLMAFALAANRVMTKGEMVPGKFQNVVEMVVELLDGIVNSAMGKSAPKFYNYIGTIFIFILVSNISGLLGLRPPTADYGVTLPLGLLTFTLIHFNQFKYHKPKEILPHSLLHVQQQQIFLAKTLFFFRFYITMYPHIYLLINMGKLFCYNKLL